MKKLSFQQQLIVFMVLLVGTCALFYYLAWKPQADQLDKINFQQRQEEDKITQAKSHLAALEALKKNAPKIETKIIKIGQKIPKTPELPELIIQIQNIANDSGIEIKTFKPTEPKVSGEYSQIEVSLNIKGSYLEIDDFLYRLENSPRALKVNDLSISGASDYPKLNCTLTLSTFIRNEGAQAAPSVPPVNPAPQQSKPGEAKT